MNLAHAVASRCYFTLPARLRDGGRNHLPSAHTELFAKEIRAGLDELFSTMPVPPDDMGSPEGLAAFAEAVLQWRADCGFPAVYDGPVGPSEVETLYDELMALCADENELILILDNMVHDAQVANASEVNNQGARAQIVALLLAGVHAETIRDQVRA